MVAIFYGEFCLTRRFLGFLRPVVRLILVELLRASVFHLMSCCVVLLVICHLYDFNSGYECMNSIRG